MCARIMQLNGTCYKNQDIAKVSIFKQMHHNDPKFSDRQVWANSVDPDQTGPLLLRSSLIRVYTVCHSVYKFWTYFSMVKLNCSNFRIIKAIFQVSEYFRILQYLVT